MRLRGDQLPLAVTVILQYSLMRPVSNIILTTTVMSVTDHIQCSSSLFNYHLVRSGSLEYASNDDGNAALGLAARTTHWLKVSEGKIEGCASAIHTLFPVHELGNIRTDSAVCHAYCILD